MKVLKFGGTSVANTEKFIHVAEIIMEGAQQQSLAVVLSAPANITNYLVKMVNQALQAQSTNEELSQINRIFSELINGLAAHYPDIESITLQDAVAEKLTQLQEILLSIAVLKQCPDSVNAKIISLGERLSITLMEALLRAKNQQVTIIDPVQVLLAEGSYLESTVNIPVSTQRIQALHLPSDHILLMPGFIAGNEAKELVVLGRNGSDYSAAILAACLSADSCEIWTDVDGVYTCDPHIVPEAQLLSTLSYQEAMELSYFGAKVLHPRTILPIAQFQIPCLIKNSRNPKAIGTLIGNHNQNDQPQLPVKGITHLSNLAMINVSGPGLKGMIGMAARIFSAMSANAISVILITQASSEYSISFCIPQNEVMRATKVLKEVFYLELHAGLLEPLQVIETLAIVSVVGDNMREQRGLSAQFFTALARSHINIIAIAQGSSERTISAVVKEKEAIVAVRAVHQCIFETARSVDVFIIGVGGVGSALLDQLYQQQDWLKKKQIKVRVWGIANSRKMVCGPHEIELNQWRTQLENHHQPFDLTTFIATAKQYHLLNPVLIDCTTSEQIALQYTHFLTEGFHVVTPNKKANTASMHYYHSLRQAAAKAGRKFLYDTNVGAGLPVIENLQNLINAGDELLHFSGILSGSLSFIFGKLDEGMSLSAATQLAKEKGYTEPDPRDDLSGIDVARKLLILAREAGYQLELKDIAIESILPDERLTQGDVTQFMQQLPKFDEIIQQRVAQAKANGEVLRYVGQINNGICKVSIIAINEEDPLYKIKEGENALAFYTHYYHPLPFVLRGYGAGNQVTGAGVFADLLRILV